MTLATLVNSIFRLYFLLLIVRIFLTWLPNIDWGKQPFAFLRIVVDPVLYPFRALIPSVGGLDFSPIVAIIFLQFVNVVIVRFLVAMGW